MKILPTGVPSLDFALGKGGLPVGKIVELYGREAAGKSSLTYYMIKSAQDRGIKCAYINVEGTFDPGFAKRIAKISLSDLDMSYPKPGTEAVEDLAEAVDGGKYGLAIFDSVGAMLGDREQDPSNVGQAGGQSLLVTRMAKIVSYPASQNECTVVFVNQVRDNFAAQISGLETSPGGHAIKHAAAARIYLKPGKPIQKTIKGELIQVGFRVQCQIIKNKIGTPKLKCGWDFWNQPSPDGVEGIDIEGNLADVVIGWDVLQKDNNTYLHPSFPAGKIVGKEKLLYAFRNDAEIRKALIEEVREFGIRQELARLEDA